MNTYSKIYDEWLAQTMIPPSNKKTNDYYSGTRLSQLRIPKYSTNHLGLWRRVQGQCLQDEFVELLAVYLVVVKDNYFSCSIIVSQLLNELCGMLFTVEVPWISVPECDSLP